MYNVEQLAAAVIKQWQDDGRPQVADLDLWQDVVEVAAEIIAYKQSAQKVPLPDKEDDLC